MIIQLLTPEDKPEPIFERVKDKVETYLFRTLKYEVELAWASSNFYAPDFYSACIRNSNGEEIWNGGKAVFLDSAFSTDFISDKYHRVILTRVNDTQNSGSMQVVLIDLKTGTEQTLTGEGFYHAPTHMISFDAVGYGVHGGFLITDFENNCQFNLTELLNKYFGSLNTWGLSPIRNCVLVFTEGDENNVALFDVQKLEVISRSTMTLRKTDLVSISPNRILHEVDSCAVTVNYSMKQESGAFKHEGTEYYRISF